MVDLPDHHQLIIYDSSSNVSKSFVIILVDPWDHQDLGFSVALIDFQLPPRFTHQRIPEPFNPSALTSAHMTHSLLQGHFPSDLSPRPKIWRSVRKLVNHHFGTPSDSKADWLRAEKVLDWIEPLPPEKALKVAGFSYFFYWWTVAPHLRAHLFTRLMASASREDLQVAAAAQGLQVVKPFLERSRGVIKRGR